MAAEEPPELPPEVRAGSNGFLVIPVIGESVTPSHPNSGEVTFPTRMAEMFLTLQCQNLPPAFLASSTLGESISSMSDASPLVSLL